MATIRERLKLGTGGLAETSSEELAAQAGRSAAPTSPLETKVLGANADQAKMAGTPAQKTSALRSAIQEGQDLQTSLRREQTRATATESEQAQLDKASQAQQLGGLQERVQALSDKALAGVLTSQPGAPLDLNLESEELSKLEPEAQNQLVGLMANLQQNPSDMEAVLQINTLLGRGQDNFLSAQDIRNLFPTANQLATDTVSARVELANTNAGELAFEELGFADQSEVEALLDVTPGSLDNMSVSQMLEQIDSSLSEEFDRVEDLTARSTDASLSANARAQARRELKEAGAVGIRSTESAIDKLADSLAQADQVSFMGEQMTIEEVLDSEYISGLITNYMTSPEDSEIRKTLKAEEPEIVKFIQENQELLDGAVKNLEPGLAEFSAIQTDNESLASLPKAAGVMLGDSAIQLSDSDMAKIIPDWGQPQSARYSTESYPVLDIMHNSTPQEASGLMQSMQMLESKAPQLRDQLLSGTLSRDEIVAFGLTDPNSQKARDFTKYLDNRSRAEALDLNNRDEIIQLVFPGQTRDTVNKAVQEAGIRERSGFFDASEAPKIPGQRYWGVNSSEIGQEYKDTFAPKSLKELIQEGVPKASKYSLDQVNSYNQQPNSVYNMIRSGLGVRDNEIDNKDVKSIFDKPDLSVQDMNEAWNSENFQNVLAPNAVNEMGFSMWKKLRPTIDSAVASTTKGEFQNVEEFKKFIQEGSFTDQDQINQARTNVRILSQNIEGLINTAKAQGNDLEVEQLEKHKASIEKDIADFTEKTNAAERGLQRTTSSRDSGGGKTVGDLAPGLKQAVAVFQEIQKFLESPTSEAYNRIKGVVERGGPALTKFANDFNIPDIMDEPSKWMVKLITTGEDMVSDASANVKDTMKQAASAFESLVNDPSRIAELPDDIRDQLGSQVRGLGGMSKLSWDYAEKSLNEIGKEGVKAGKTLADVPRKVQSYAESRGIQLDPRKW